MRIKFDNVTCGYGKKAVLKNINCDIELGDKVAVLGPNGIGKSTLFKTLFGFIDIIDGAIYLEDRNIRSYTGKQLASILAYVPQAKGYSYQYTVEDMVLMGRASHIGNFSKPTKSDVEIAVDAIERIGISKLRYKYYSELSGGEQQCVLVARAIAQGAKFLVMDEPASNLDLKNQKKLLDVVNSLANDGIGIIMATHSPEHVFISCNKVLLINKDGSSTYGSMSELMTVDNLKSAFGVDIDIIESTNTDGITKKAICLL